MPEPPRASSGLAIGEAFYHEHVRAIALDVLGDTPHSAALLGRGSDVLGYDTARSTDHSWAPRCQIFLAPGALKERGESLRGALRARLPVAFRGHSVHLGAADPEDRGSRVPAPGRAGDVHSLVEVCSWEDFLRHLLGHCALDPDPFDWLAFPDQTLLEITSGAVFHDGLGTLASERARFAWLPRDVWLYRLAAQWYRIAEEEPFIGRTRELGDEIGGRVLAARLARAVMHLAFLMERRYAPYSKWLGSAFAELACAARLGPPLLRATGADSLAERERALGEAYVECARMHERLGITEPLSAELREFFSRPYTVIGAERFAHAIQQQIGDEKLRSFSPALGSVDQLVSATDALGSTRLTGALRRLYPT